MEIADKLRQARMKRGYTQRELAKKIKVSPSAVAQWELGTTKPSLDKLMRLSFILDTRDISILDAEENKIEITTRDGDEILLLKWWRELNIPAKLSMLRMIEEAAEKSRKDGEDNRKRWSWLITFGKNEDDDAAAEKSGPKDKETEQK